MSTHTNRPIQKIVFNLSYTAMHKLTHLHTHLYIYTHMYVCVFFFFFVYRTLSPLVAVMTINNDDKAFLEQLHSYLNTYE